MQKINKKIVACYLYTITKHGYPPPAEDSLKHMDEYHQLGFTAIELEGIRKSHIVRMFEERKAIKAKADSINLNIPVFCVVLPGLSSPDESERQRSLELFRKGCKIAVDLGAGSVLDNAPLPPYEFPAGIPVTRHYDEDILSGASIPSSLNWKSYWDALTDTYRQACDIASKKKLNYHIHPCYGSLVNSTDAFLQFFDSVKRDNLRFNLDTANQYFMKDNIFLSLIRLKDYIDYIHISDNRGQRVEHLSAGDGAINWNKFFETLDMISYRGLFGIDVGGAESDVKDLDKAYVETAKWLNKTWFEKN